MWLPFDCWSKLKPMDVPKTNSFASPFVRGSVWQGSWHKSGRQTKIKIERKRNLETCGGCKQLKVRHENSFKWVILFSQSNGGKINEIFVMQGVRVERNHKSFNKNQTTLTDLLLQSRTWMSHALLPAQRRDISHRWWMPSGSSLLWWLASRSRRRWCSQAFGQCAKAFDHSTSKVRLFIEFALIQTTNSQMWRHWGQLYVPSRHERCSNALAELLDAMACIQCL